MVPAGAPSDNRGSGSRPPVEPPCAPSPCAAPRDRPGFGAGVRALFSGFGFVLSTPGVWPLALVPVAIAAALTSALGAAAVAHVPSKVHALLGARGGGLLGDVLGVVATAIAMLLAALLALALSQPLSGPALERIVRRAEAKLGAPAWPPTSLVADVLRSLESILVSFAFGLPLLAILLLIGVAFPPAAVVTTPLKLAVTAVLIAWDLCDYPLSIRGIPISARVAFMRRNAAAMLGFGFGLALLGLIPCLLVLVLPAGVAGAARLIVDAERWEAGQRGGGRGA
ncbi:MAG: EI24 domain-containing protein [Polyangiaceae bacterium]|nr:EI24 domain-containing protein [Polyangiaceae bacterium]